MNDKKDIKTFEAGRKELDSKFDGTSSQAKVFRNDVDRRISNCAWRSDNINSNIIKIDNDNDIIKNYGQITEE